MSYGKRSGRWLGAAVLAAAWIWALPVDSVADKVSTGDTRTDGVIVALQEKLKAVEACRAQVTTGLLLEGEVYTILDSAVYLVPGRFRLERRIEEDVRQTIVSDGSLLWIHDHSENMVSRVNLSRVYKATRLEADGDQPDPTRPFRGLEWMSIRYQQADTVGTELCRTFEAEPKPMALFAELPTVPVKVRFSVQPEDGLTRQVAYLGPDGEVILSHRFEHVVVNPKLDETAFQFVVPPRALVMDATEDTIEMLKAASEGGETGEAP